MASEKTVGNQCLYALEGIACLSVVLIHAHFPGQFGVLMDLWARFAVPVFFIIAGYYFYREDRAEMQKRLPQKIQKTAWLAGASLAAYFIYDLLLLCAKTVLRGEVGAVWEWLRKTFSGENLLRWVLLNTCSVAGHLWFLFALLYVYLILWVCLRTEKGWAWIQKAPCLLLVGEVLNVFFTRHPVQLGRWDLSDYTLYRNWLLDGLPFFALGMAFRKQENAGKRYRAKFFLVLLLLSVCAAPLEQKFVGTTLDYHFSTIITAAVLFLLAVQNAEFPVPKVLVRLGKQDSTGVYLVQLAVIDGIDLVGRTLWGTELPGCFRWLVPVMAMLDSIFVTEGWNALTQRFFTKP